MPGSRIVVWPDAQVEDESDDAPWQQGGGGYSWVPWEVLDLSPNAVACFAYLTNYPRERQWLRISDIIEQSSLRWSEDDVREGMAELAAVGKIEQVDTGEDEPSWRVA